jgi:nucleotide-binding universal stress UspA family protein
VEQALEKAGLASDPLFEQLEIEASEYLEAMGRLLSKNALKFSHVVLRGLAADAIVEYATQTDIQMIVMASHGYTAIERWTHGSVAERVLQSSPVPILLVRAKQEATEALPAAHACDRTLVPLDGSRLAEQVLPTILPIAQALGCELTLFRVPVAYSAGPLTGRWYLPQNSSYETADQDAQAYLERVADHIRQQGVQVTTATQVGPVAESIIAYAQAHDVDLIAMCTHGRTGLARWALGSVADRVLRAGDKPILLVRAGKG